MLQSNLELIVQYPGTGRYMCRGFRGLHLLSSVYLVFDGSLIADQSVARSLGKSFCEEILRYAGAQEETVLPCGGCLPSVDCHAVDEATCRKILVLVAATGGVAEPAVWPTPSAEAKWLSYWPQPTWEVIPVLPEGARPHVAAYVPAPWRGINVCCWSRDPIEALWAVLQRVGLAPEESRIFISYVRRDTTAIADQLFEKLTDAGFDVFLDRCSVPVGVQFQERIMQDLCDKAMVILLNSANVANSHWVAEEIAIIKTYRLGLLELRLPGGVARRDIDPDFTVVLDGAHDLVPAGATQPAGAQELSAARLTSLISHIKDVHGRALHRRRYELIDNFAAALAFAGKTAQMLPDGTFIVPPSSGGSGGIIGLTVRPPELGDFCALHQRGQVSATRAGWLVSPSPFFLAHRQAHACWLGGVSNIQHANEAQIKDLAASL